MTCLLEAATFARMMGAYVVYEYPDSRGFYYTQMHSGETPRFAGMRPCVLWINPERDHVPNKGA
jgi:hypothetical protein